MVSITVETEVMVDVLVGGLRVLVTKSVSGEVLVTVAVT